MRESCFRGKRLSDGKWVYGESISTQYDVEGEKRVYVGALFSSHIYPLMKGVEWHEVDPATVGEFSGKCDDNDRRIFEGDIADGLFCFTTPVRAVCVFKDGAFGLKWTHGGVDHFSAFTSICNVACEMVVGNIYDNPELLEQEVE